MPCENDIIGLTGVEIESGSRSQRIVLEARFVGRTSCVHCESKRYRIKSTFTRKLKHTRQGTKVMEVWVRSHKFLCLVCRRYFNLRIPGVMPRRSATENYGIGEATVER
jgi:hypothetical protein